MQPYFVSYEFGVEEIFLFDETEKAELEFRDTFPIPSVQLLEGHFYNIRTNVYGGVESVAVSVAINDFIEARIENFVQYDAFIPGGRLLPPGNYTVMSQPFSENRAQGEAGGPVSFTFEAFY